MYKTERLTGEISVDRYIEEFVNIAEFLECCKVCENYERKWSCPPYDFDVMEYWKKYDSLLLIGSKIIFSEESREQTYREEALKRIISEVLSEEKQKLTEALYEMEKDFPGSISLSAGSCNICEKAMLGENKCSRVFSHGEGSARTHCLHFDQMRHSIESLGGNVGKTCSKLLNVELNWAEEGKLPEHFILLCGLLKKSAASA